MTDSLALNGLSGYGYGYGYDPYFMKAFQSYNANMPQAQNPVQMYPQVQVPSEQTKTDSQPKEEGKSNAGLIIGGLATAGAAALLYKANKKGGEKGIKEGLKQMWQGLTGKAASASTEKFALRQSQTGEWFAQVPGRKQRLTGNYERFGISTEIPGIGDKGSKIIDFRFTKDGNSFHVRNGRVVEYKNSAGENLLAKMNNPTEAKDIDYKKAIDEFIAKVDRRDEAALKELTSMNYTHTADGVTRRFSKTGDNVTMNKVVTDRFALGTDEVTAMREKDPKIDKAVKAIKEGKRPEGLNAVAAEYKVDDIVFKIENDRIVGMTQGGKYYPAASDRFVAWQYNNQKDYEKMIKNIGEGKDMYNITWQA